MGKTLKFSCKIKLYIQNKVISSRNGILFSNNTQTIISIDIYKLITDMLNVKHYDHFFSNHHDDLLQNVLCLVLHLQQTVHWPTVHKCLVKYAVFIHNTQIHCTKYILLFFFITILNTMYTVFIPYYAMVYIYKQQKNLLNTVTVNNKYKRNMLHPSVTVWPQHLIHITSYVCAEKY